MGLLTLIRRNRLPYRVRAHAPGHLSEQWFATLQEARAYADRLAEDGCICVVYRNKDPKPIYCTDEDWGDQGSSGVREPRRPLPGSSAGAISLDLPD
jgi:hypothetical protein